MKLRLVVTAAVLLACLLAPSGVAAKKRRPPPCPGGVFWVEGAPLVSSGLPAPDAVAIESGVVSLLSGCGATTVKLKATRRGTKLRAKWQNCPGIQGRVKLKARIDPSCASMTGKLRARKLRRNFSAHTRAPTLPGRCGDGLFDAGESCDDGGTASCDGCAADCSRQDTVCGDDIVECGEACDGEGSCPAGETCENCRCVAQLFCGETPSACGSRQYCSDSRDCICIRSAEGPIRCGRIPSTCDVQLCQTSADCVILGEGYFCDTPNSGCCSDPPKELPRCIAPCTPPALPSCAKKTFTDSEIDAAVDTAMANVADPWGKDLGLVFSRTSAALQCDLAIRATGAGEVATAPPSIGPADCSSSYCSNVRYCGRGNSESNPGFPFPANRDCLNRACFEHDRCYDEKCIATNCLWSPQSTACDQPFFDSCNSCNPVNEEGLRPSTYDAITCSIAKKMARRDQQPACAQPPPECKGCEVCQNDACVDSPPPGYQTCGDECCQGPCAPEGGCCSAFRFCQNATVCCPLGQSCISPLDRSPFCCSALKACQDGGFGEKKVCCDEDQSCKCSLAGCSCQ